MTETADYEYVLGTQSDELERLKMQHDLWIDLAEAQWDRAGIGTGQTVLDLGCGPGFALRELARRVGPEGRAVGVDVSRRFLEHAQQYASQGTRAIVETHHVDAHEMPFDQDTFDAVYARWVFCFTPDPARVVEQLARVVRPDGVVVIHDYMLWTNLFWTPGGEGLTALKRAILSMYGAQRADSNVGQKLPMMLESSGFEVEEIEPVHRIARPGDAMWQWPTVFFRTFLPKVVEAGHMTRQEYELWEAEWRTLEETPGAFFLTPPQVEIRARRHA